MRLISAEEAAVTPWLIEGENYDACPFCGHDLVEEHGSINDELWCAECDRRCGEE